MTQDYKDSLHLPITKFKMKANLTQKEREMLKEWDKDDLYNKILSSKDENKKFIFHDGPPYANGHIHMGHALNKLLKDFIIKYKSMNGYKVKFIPGWDCHGLPIELKVDQNLGSKKKNMTKIEIRDKCKSYALNFVNIQRDEFKRLGVFADWKNPYLTVNKEYESTIARYFGEIVKAGNVFKQKKPIYWCSHCETALAEAEIEYEDHTSESIYVKFELLDKPELLNESLKGEKVNIVIWTTTPWTLPANLAVSLHPREEYSFLKIDSEIYVVADKLSENFQENIIEKRGEEILKLKGKDFENFKLKHPIFKDKTSLIILGEHVTMDTGTGAVHTAPGHGEDDYIVGMKYKLDVFAPVNNQGKFTDEVPKYEGMSIWQANPEIIKDLETKGILIKTEKINHSYPHCWRCKKPIIFRATDQWFISMEKNNLRKNALSEIDKTNWIPSWGHDRIYNMVESRPDWCISRQRSWGVPIIALTCNSCEKSFTSPEIIEHVANIFEKDGSNSWFEKNLEELLPEGTKCPYCGSADFKKEEDIVDVWFESGISYAAVSMRDKDMGFPVELYLEGSDQHRGWFHSSLLTSTIVNKQAPYKSVLTHGFVVDSKGRKMSKSLGNVISPDEIIKKHGAEILRIWVAAEDYRDDIRISQEIISRLIEGYRRIRNTIRFLLGNISDFTPSEDSVPYEELLPIDKYILHENNLLIEKVTKYYENYTFHNIFHSIHNYCIVDLSSIYLDILKDRLYTWGKDSKGRRAGQTVIYRILKTLLQLLAPIMSFTTDEAWKFLPEEELESVHLSIFPIPDEKHFNESIKSEWTKLLTLKEEVNLLLEEKRKDKIIGHSLDAKIIIKPNSEIRELLEKYKEELPFIFIVSQVELSENLVDGIESEKIKGLYLKFEKAKGEKCARCWNYSETVGDNKEYPDVCNRCAKVLKDENEN